MTDKTAAHESKGQAEDFPWETWERVESLLRGEDWSPPPPAEHRYQRGWLSGGQGLRVSHGVGLPVSPRRPSPR